MKPCVVVVVVVVRGVVTRGGVHCSVPFQLDPCFVPLSAVSVTDLGQWGFKGCPD